MRWTLSLDDFGGDWQNESGDFCLCASALEEYFDIPEEEEKIYVYITQNPKPQSYYFEKPYKDSPVVRIHLSKRNRYGSDVEYEFLLNETLKLIPSQGYVQIKVDR